MNDELSANSQESNVDANHPIRNVIRAIHPPAHLAQTKAIAEMLEQHSSISHLSNIASAVRIPKIDFPSQILSAIKLEQQLAQSFKASPYISELTRLSEGLKLNAERMLTPFTGINEAIRKQTAVFNELTRSIQSVNSLRLNLPDIGSLRLSHEIASIGLTNRLSQLELLGSRPLLSERLFDFSHVYTTFVKDTAAKLALDPTANVAQKLRASLYLAESQLLDVADSLGSAISVPVDDDSSEETRDLDAFYEQQSDLLLSNDSIDEYDLVDLTSASPTAQRVQIAKEILDLVALCNEAGKTCSSNHEIFKPTTRLLSVFSDFPFLVANDKNRFADFIDCLYFIFYEGAGKDNLRFLSKNGGTIDDSECDFIWCIKHLRNKWSRHDPDHGREKDINKSWSDLSAKFKSLGMPGHPYKTEHFQQMQGKLLEFARDFLQLILSRFTL